jgi:diacylglycerol kinase family enzyme
MTGPRMLIGPTARPDDQLLDVVCLPADRRQDMLDWLGEGPDDRPPPLVIRKARKVTLSWQEGPLRVDDEVFDAPELASNIIVELEPNGLRVCVPEARG